MAEWLETNGSGGFCCSTDTERNERKYHGLLVCPVRGYEGRYHFLSAADSALLDGSGLTLGTNIYPGAVYPESDKYIVSREFLPWPGWVYSNGGSTVKKEVFMRKGETAVWIAYTLLEGPESAGLALKLLFTFRNSNELTKANDSINKTIVKTDEGLTVRPYDGLPAAQISLSGEWSCDGDLYWDYNVCYEMERDRGHEWIEDRFVPGDIILRLKKDQPFIIRVKICGQDDKLQDSIQPEDMPVVYLNEKAVRKPGTKLNQEPLRLLKYQARHFLLTNPSGKKSINAGFPWFGEWGRDTMISLPGLTFYNGDADTGIDILCDYIAMIKDGLLPNTLGDTQGFTSYNSIDAGLLFSWAVGKLLRKGYGRIADEKDKLANKLLPAIESIISAFIENRVPCAEITEKGMLKSGSSDTQLTWMDATAWGRPVTPRYGFAVELNALWYDAIYIYDLLCRELGQQQRKDITGLLDIIPGSFIDTFWIEDGRYLSDTVNENGPDGKIRPNMLFASSACPGLIDLEKRRSVVTCVEEHLLTPMGLRTLSPGDPDFRGEYIGGPDERDSVYHQGTVWPWPIGIMIESSIFTDPDIEQKAKFWSDYISGLLEKHLFNEGWGFISEVFDGLNPGRGKGCFAQAWSCSEVIRAAELINGVLKNGRSYNERKL